MELGENGDRLGEVEEELDLGDAMSIPSAVAHGNPFTEIDTIDEEGWVVVPGSKFHARDVSDGRNLSPKSKTSGWFIGPHLPESLTERRESGKKGSKKKETLP